MIRLTGAELVRLRARRSFWVFALGALLLVAVFQLATNVTLRPPSAEQIASAQQSYQEAHREWVQQCSPTGSPTATPTVVPAPGNGAGGGNGSGGICDGPEPQRSDYTYGTTPFAEVARTSVQIATVLGVLLAFVIGASSIGAEYSTGAIGNWLTYVPRRGRVFAAKTVAVALVTVACSAVLGAAGVVGPVLVARGYDVALTGLGSVVGYAARAVIVVGVAGLVGFCAALLTRHTVAAVGIALGYALVSSIGTALLSGSRYGERIIPWTPQANAQAVLEHDHHFQVFLPGAPGSDGGSTREAVVTLEHGVVYLAVLLAVVLAVSLLVFRRRDVG